MDILCALGTSFDWDKILLVVVWVGIKGIIKTVFLNKSFRKKLENRIQK